jgi:hypothetical protein
MSPISATITAASTLSARVPRYLANYENALV